MDSRITARALAVALGGWRTREPAYEALADGIRVLCLDNRLAARTLLPAERELAHALHLSRTTVAGAYRSLRDSGHIESLRGSGSVTLPRPHREPARAAVGDDEVDLQRASLAAWPGLAGVMTDVALDASAIVARAGYDVRGSLALRSAIAERYTRLGVPTHPEEILVTTGAQAAISLLAHTLLRRGDRAAIETPTYPNAADALRAAGARLVGVPVTTTDGWDVDRAQQAFARTSPTLAYLMPRYQNPTGRCMSWDEEHAFAAAAAGVGTTLVIDETTGELTIDGLPQAPAFLGADVVRIGSLAKTVWGGLRIGWVRADRDLVQRLVAARPPHDLGTPEFEQAVGTRLVERLDEILPQRSALLREGRDVLREELARLLPQWRVPDVAGGVAMWIQLDAPLSTAIVLAARAHGIHLSSGSRFGVDAVHDRHLRLPFTATTDELRRSVAVLARLWPTVQGVAPASHADLLDAVV
ncbi:MAG: PLP-dependent aminotransferase family protein [Microbacterium sp.]|nr:MAG: PLP-dependent aminotransferase family protein [Microbacterium sp.]